jgi:hypothetical protein
MSDQQLRELAATRAQGAQQPGQEDDAQTRRDAQLTANTEAPESNAAQQGAKAAEDAPKKGSIDVNTDDAQSLEDAIK